MWEGKKWSLISLELNKIESQLRPGTAQKYICWVIRNKGFYPSPETLLHNNQISCSYEMVCKLEWSSFSFFCFFFGCFFVLCCWCCVFVAIRKEDEHFDDKMFTSFRKFVCCIGLFKAKTVTNRSVWQNNVFGGWSGHPKRRKNNNNNNGKRSYT